MGCISCSKREQLIHLIEHHGTVIMGHGGMGVSSTYPMNSFESLLKCYYSGAGGTEMDIQLSKDNQLIAFHDYTLDEKSNLNGLVREHTWDELKTGLYKHTPHSSYSIVRLTDFFESLPENHDFLFSFDCKMYPDGQADSTYFTDYVQALHYLINASPQLSSCCIESQSTELLSAMKSLNPSVKLFYYPGSFDTGFELAQIKGYTGITISTRNITKEQVQQAQDHGLEVILWNTHTKKDNLEALEKGPNYIQTDKLAHLIR